MRKAGIAALAGAFALSLAGCSGASSDDRTESAPDIRDSDAANETRDACSGDPVVGGALTYARQAETQTLNPLAIRNGNGDIFADGLIYQGLVQYDPSGSTEVVAGVADDWDVSADGKTYTFHIREGVKFSNGDPVTAEDVKFSLDGFGDPETNAVMAVLAVGYESARVVDESTVEVTLSQPVPSFLDNIATFPAAILPKRLVESQGDSFWKDPVGTGPFMLKEFVSGSYVTFERNPHYWDAPRPYLDEVKFNFATDANSRLLSLTSGDAQVMDGVTPAQISQIRDDEELVLQGYEIPAWIEIFPNHRREEFADLDVRQAIAHAIDREAINEQIFDGLGTIPNSVLPQLRYDAGPDVVAPYTYDLEKAKEFMADSDFPDGFSAKLSYPAGLDYFDQLGLLVQQQLGAIGIDVELVKEDSASLYSNFAEYDYDLSFAFPVLTSDVAVPDEFASFFTSPDGDGFNTNWANSEIAAAVADFTVNPDEASRAEEWPKIQQALMDQQPAINILDVPLLNAFSQNVCGADVNALGVDQLQNTWITTD